MTALGHDLPLWPITPNNCLRVDTRPSGVAVGIIRRSLAPRSFRQSAPVIPYFNQTVGQQRERNILTCNETRCPLVEGSSSPAPTNERSIGRASDELMSDEKIDLELLGARVLTLTAEVR